MIGLVPLMEKEERPEHACPLLLSLSLLLSFPFFPQCEDTARSLEELSHQEQNLPHFVLGLPRLQTLRNRRLWQPKPTKTPKHCHHLTPPSGPLGGIRASETRVPSILPLLPHGPKARMENALQSAIGHTGPALRRPLDPQQRMEKQGQKQNAGAPGSPKTCGEGIRGLKSKGQRESWCRAGGRPATFQ